MLFFIILLLLLFIIIVPRVANIWDFLRVRMGEEFARCRGGHEAGFSAQTTHTQRHTVAGSSERLSMVATESQHPGEAVKT